MSSIKRRPDGMWRARYRDHDGREHSRHFDRKSDGDAWLTQVKSELLRGTYIDPRAGKQTFESYSTGWLAAQPIRPGSRRAYASYLRNHLVPAFGNRPLTAIKPTDVRGLVRKLQDALAPNTARAVHSLLAAVMKAAVGDGCLAKSPCQGTAPPKPRREKVKPLEMTQVRALIDNAPDRYRAAIVLAAGCGLRLGEVLGLRLHRVRFLVRELDVVEQLLLHPGAPPVLSPPKTPCSVRTVALPQVVSEALARHLELFPSADPEGLVFRSRTGGPVWPNSFHGAVWQPLVQRAGLPVGTRFHDLRHFYASALIRAGESVKTVQDALGHSSAVETLETYAGLWPDAPERTRAAVDSIFSGVSADQVRTEDRAQGS